MHRDLKVACIKTSVYDFKAQQRLLNRFVREYNHVRPHEALGMETPAFIHIFPRDHFPRKYINLILSQTLEFLK
ncbi:integrase core domain-containing protein [Ancylomarina sp. YFZ004]